MGHKCKLTAPCPSSTAFLAARPPRGRRSMRRGSRAGKGCAHHRAAGDPRPAPPAEPARTSASEGMIRVYDQFRPGGDDRSRSLAPGRAAAEPAVESQQPGRALRPHGRARSTTDFAADVLDSARHLAAQRPAAAARRHGARGSCCCSSRITWRRARCWNAPSPGMATMPIYWRTSRAPMRRPATMTAPRRSSGARSNSSPTRKPRSTG